MIRARGGFFRRRLRRENKNITNVRACKDKICDLTKYWGNALLRDPARI